MLIPEDRAAIGEVKARYCRYIDTARFDDVGAAFAPDGVLQFGPDESSNIEGPAAIAALLREQLAEANTTHQVHSPEMRLEEDGSVHVIWAMQDRVETSGYRLDGSGYYEERYVLLEGGWRIAHSRIHRLRVDFQPRSLAIRVALLLHRMGLLKRLMPAEGTQLEQALAEGVPPGTLP